MFHPLRALRERAEAEDARMRANGFDAIATGPLSRTYRLDPDYLAARRAEAERERVAQMGCDAMELHALAFPQQHAELLARQAAIEPAPAGASSLEQIVATLADRLGIPDRVVFERLTIERGRPS